MATHLDLPTLPVSTNICLSSHTETQTHTCAQTITRAHTVLHAQTYKIRERRPAKGSADDGFKYRRDERARLHGFKERKDGVRQRGREFRGGTWGDQRGISESIPCWTVWALVAVSRHENKHRQMWRRDWFTCKALPLYTHTPGCIHREADAQNTSLWQMRIQK